MTSFRYHAIVGCVHVLEDSEAESRHRKNKEESIYVMCYTIHNVIFGNIMIEQTFNKINSIACRTFASELV